MDKGSGESLIDPIQSVYGNYSIRSKSVCLWAYFGLDSTYYQLKVFL